MDGRGAAIKHKIHSCKSEERKVTGTQHAQCIEYRYGHAKYKQMHAKMLKQIQHRKHNMEIGYGSCIGIMIRLSRRRCIRHRRQEGNSLEIG